MSTALAVPLHQVPVAPLRPGTVTLIVRDLDRVSRYYEDTIGPHRIDAKTDSSRLGAGGQTLLHLVKRAGADLEPHGFAGLFHTVRDAVETADP